VLSGECTSDSQCTRYNPDGTHKCDTGNLGTESCNSGSVSCTQNPALPQSVNCEKKNDEGFVTESWGYWSGNLIFETHYDPCFCTQIPHTATGRTKVGNPVTSTTWGEWDNGPPPQTIEEKIPNFGIEPRYPKLN